MAMTNGSRAIGKYESATARGQRQEAVIGGGNKRQGQDPAPHPAQKTGQADTGRRRLRVQPTHLWQQILAHGRQFDGALRTHEQRHAEHVF